MRSNYFYDVGTGTASAVVTFLVTRPGTIHHVLWNCYCLGAGADNGLEWILSTSPVAQESVQGSDINISRVGVVNDFLSAVGVTSIAKTFLDSPDWSMPAGSYLYFHRSASIAAPTVAAMTCVIRWK